MTTSENIVNFFVGYIMEIALTLRVILHITFNI